MRTHVFMLQIGDRLITDTFNTVGLNILASGTILDADDIHKLTMHNIDYVDISVREPEFEEETYVIPSLFQVQALTFTDAVEGIKDIFHKAEKEGLIIEEEVDASFNPLINSFQEQKDVVALLLALNSKDDYTYQHSVQVGMLSYYLAKWLDKPESEALRIGKAGYLHDIGKSKVDSEILQKTDPLTNDELDEIKKHTIYGYEIIKHSFQDEPLALVALQHHERLDGTGYPLRKRDSELHSYSKIVAVADVYSSMISKRAFQDKRDLLYVLKELNSMSFGELDPKTTQVFIKHMIPNFIGKRVALSDGSRGTIIMTNPTDFFKPLIQVSETFIDLSHDSQLEITSIEI
jgi:putative nucleotidyltransferase with HDIG domain